MGDKERSREEREAMAHQDGAHGITYIAGILVPSDDYGEYYVSHRVPGSTSIAKQLTGQEPIMGQTPGDAPIHEQIAAKRDGLSTLKALGVNIDEIGKLPK